MAEYFNIPIEEELDGVIPVLNSQEIGLIVNYRNKISCMNKNEFVKNYSIPYSKWNLFLSNFQLLKRVLRLDIKSIECMANGDLVAITKGAIIHKKKESDTFKKVFNITRGSRPLNLCKHKNGNLYWGEYFSNDNRDEVHVYESLNGKEWNIKYSFKKRSIRHIHGIFWDEYRNGMWVLTGDSDNESGLWFTTDKFESLNLIEGGSQKSRAVTIITLKDELIIPMDSPKEVNYIQKYTLNDRRFENLKELPGSVFYSYASKEVNLISTIIEPSEINCNKYVEIFASIKGERWISIAKMNQDVYSSISYKYFRYPEVFFAKEDYPAENIYLYCSGVKKYNNKTLTINKKKLVSFLKQ